MFLDNVFIGFSMPCESCEKIEIKNFERSPSWNIHTPFITTILHSRGMQATYCEAQIHEHREANFYVEICFSSTLLTVWLNLIWLLTSVVFPTADQQVSSIYCGTKCHHQLNVLLRNPHILITWRRELCHGRWATILVRRKCRATFWEVIMLLWTRVLLPCTVLSPAPYLYVVTILSGKILEQFWNTFQCNLFATLFRLSATLLVYLCICNVFENPFFITWLFHLFATH